MGALCLLVGWSVYIDLTNYLPCLLMINGDEHVCLLGVFLFLESACGEREVGDTRGRLLDKD